MILMTENEDPCENAIAERVNGILNNGKTIITNKKQRRTKCKHHNRPAHHKHFL